MDGPREALMFGIGLPDLLVCALVGFFVFGPERLPGLARDAARVLRQARELALSAGTDLRPHLPASDDFGLQEFREDWRGLRDLHPTRMITKALLQDETEPNLPTPATIATTGGPHESQPVAPPAFDVDAT